MLGGELAPISDLGWGLLDREAKERLTPALAARRLVDFSGPHGWQHSATNLGRTTPLSSSPSEGVSGLQRRVLPLVELRADFQLSTTELRDADRGADETDLEPLDKAAHQIAAAENIAVLHGWQGARSGIGETSPHEPIALGEAADRYPQAVAGAVERLLQSGLAQDPRGADRVGTRRDRSDRGQPERRRLHLRLRPRPVDRI